MIFSLTFLFRIQKSQIFGKEDEFILHAFGLDIVYLAIRSNEGKTSQFLHILSRDDDCLLAIKMLKITTLQDESMLIKLSDEIEIEIKLAHFM